MIRVTSTSTIAAVILATCSSLNAGITAGQVNDASVWAGGSLSTGRDVTINGSIAGQTIWMDTNTQVTGSSWSEGSTSFGSNVVFGGDINAGSVSVNSGSQIAGNVYHGGSAWVANNASVGGSVTYSEHVTDFDSSSAPIDLSFNAGSGSIWHSKGSSVNMDAGSYGSLSVDKDSVIYLTSGTYEFSSIWLGQKTRIVADTSNGEVVVNVAGSLSLDRDFILEGNAADIIFNVGGNASLSRNTSFTGSLIADGGISIDRDSRIDGIAWAQGNIWLDRNTTIGGTAPMSMGGGGSGSIPEPASLAMLGLGAVLCGGRTRLGKKR